MEPLNVSVEECAKLLGLGVTITKNLIRTGAILSYREGRRRVVPMSAIREYQAQRLADARAEREAEVERERVQDGIVFRTRGRA